MPSGELQLKEIHFDDSYEALKHMDFILHLNSTNITIDVLPAGEQSGNNPLQREKGNDYPLPEPSSSKRFLAEKTQQISIVYNVVHEELVGESTVMCPAQWCSFINYILETCPNLTSLRIKVLHQPAYGISLDSRLARISKASQQTTSEILTKLDNHQFAKVTVEFRDFLNRYEREIFFNSDYVHLASLGESLPNEHFSEDEISRVIKVPTDGSEEEHELVITLLNDDDDDDSCGMNSIEMNQVIEDNLDPECWDNSNAYNDNDDDDYYIHNGYDTAEEDDDYDHDGDY